MATPSQPLLVNADRTALGLTPALPIVTVDAGVNLSARRPAGAAAVYWRFNAGVNVGTVGENIVNRKPGDLVFVADA